MNPHDEPEHVGTPPEGAVHTIPHPLQFSGSVTVSTQEPEQLVRPPAQVPVHLPAEHTWAPHEVAQFPQCRESEVRSTHAPLQSV